MELKSIKIILFALLFSAQLVFGFLAFQPRAASANASIPKWAIPEMKIKIPGLDKFSQPKQCGTKTIDGKTNPVWCINWIGEYIRVFYKFAIGVVGILATVMMMIGGLVWMTAGGDSGKVGEAKSYIGASISGLVIAFASYMILYQINPELTRIKPIKVVEVNKVEMTTTTISCQWKPGLIDGIGKHITNPSQTCGNNYYLASQNQCPAKTEETKNWWNCCCQRLGGEWSYQEQISQQKKDISPALQQLINCMRPKLPVGVGEISSISDSKYVGDLEKCNSNGCPTSPKCTHSCKSCHYGGGVNHENKSYAVDFGDEKNAAIITSVARECDGNVLDEGNHIHVSAPGCRGS